MNAPASSPLPLVTVVTVCFNLVSSGRTKHFHECLQAVHNQDYPHIEHLIIDGASTDGTVDMLQELEQKGWIRYISEPDAGIYDAMNKAIRHAQGKYIAYLNSDDFWHDSRAVSASVEMLERSGAAFSYAPRNVIFENGALKYTESAVAGVFPLLMPFCHQTMFTQKAALLRHNGFDDKNFKSAADYDLVFRMIISGEKGVFVPLNFTSFRLSGFSDGEGKQIGRHEMKQTWQRVLGNEAASDLSRGFIRDTTFQDILQRVDSQVAVDMLHHFVSRTPGQYKLRHGLIQRDSEGYTVARHMQRSEATVRLFGILPLLKCKARTTRTDWSLFGFIPLLRKRDNQRAISYLLFFFLPIISVAKQR